MSRPFYFSSSLPLGLQQRASSPSLDQPLFSQLLHRQLHAPPYALLQTDDWPVPQPLLRLIDAKIPRHTRILNSLAIERRTLTQHRTNNLTQRPQHQPQVLWDPPHLVNPMRAPRRMPHQTAEVPEVSRAVVGDDEGLAVDALVVQRHSRRIVGEQQGVRGEQVAVGDVLNVCPIEKVIVVADLPVTAALEIDVDYVELRLHVAFAYDACGADGGGEEFGVVCAVGFENDLFSGGLHGNLVSILDPKCERRWTNLPWSQCSIRTGPSHEAMATARPR